MSDPISSNELVILPKIDEDMREQFMAAVSLLEPDEDGDLGWSQDAVDFACILKGCWSERIADLEHTKLALQGMLEACEQHVKILQEQRAAHEWGT